jgi:hypothetical protein
VGGLARPPVAARAARRLAVLAAEGRPRLRQDQDRRRVDAQEGGRCRSAAPDRADAGRLPRRHDQRRVRHPWRSRRGTNGRSSTRRSGCSSGRTAAQALLLLGRGSRVAARAAVRSLWADEIAAWQYPQETWDMALLGLRLGETRRRASPRRRSRSASTATSSTTPTASSPAARPTRTSRTSAAPTGRSSAATRAPTSAGRSCTPSCSRTKASPTGSANGCTSSRRSRSRTSGTASSTWTTASPPRPPGTRSRSTTTAT